MEEINEENFTLIDINGKEIQADNINLIDDEMLYGDYEIVEVTQEEFNNGEIVCPFTGTKDIYRVSEMVFASFETEEPFMVVIKD